MLKKVIVITSIQSVWVTRPSRSNLGAIRAHLGPVCGAWRKFCGFKASMWQYKYELICFRTAFCFAHFSAPFNRTKMVLYSKCAYGSQFSGEKNDLKIRSLVAEILSKNPVLFFLGHPVHIQCQPPVCLEPFRNNFLGGVGRRWVVDGWRVDGWEQF